MRRQFNSNERVSMYVSSDGRCSICGTELQPGWHADHVKPFSEGGETSVNNSQALCPDCNLKKGNKMSSQHNKEWYSKMRDWQEKALEKWLKHNKDHFLCVATPGAGKTRFAIECMRSFLEIPNRRIIVVCPTAHIKRQWSDATAKHGIKLDYKFKNKNGAISADVNGICTTYQAVASVTNSNSESIDLYGFLTSQKETMVIFDEIHHAGEDKTWGDSLRKSFDRGVKKLSLSGTPFRSDKNRIPFINYENHISVPDFIYSYGEAVDASPQVCRLVYFPTIDGEMIWADKKGVRTFSFSDEINEDDANKRLRTAIEPDGGWLKEALYQADKRLEDIRNSGHTQAGGLALARDMASSHAQDIANILKSIAGEDQVVVVGSDIPDASKIIKRFKDSNKKWLVAVKMVSEGVDIPRLRVCVHATNVTSKLFVRQAVGRVVRYDNKIQDETGQSAYYYIPADPRLIDIAKEIDREISHSLEESAEKDQREFDANENRSPSLVPISSKGWEGDFFARKDDRYSVEEIFRARQECDRVGISRVLDLQIAEIIRGASPQKREQQQSMIHDNVTDEKTNLKKKVHKLVNRISTIHNIKQSHVYSTVNRIQGVNQDLATVDHLKKRIGILTQWLAVGEIDGAISNGSYERSWVNQI